MKRTILLSLVALCLLQFSLPVSAQQSATSGNFTVTQNGTTIEASYTLMPAAPDNIVLMIRATGTLSVNARIVDENGGEVIKLDPATVSGRYVNNIDISKLAPGNYQVELMGASGEAVYKITFSK